MSILDHVQDVSEYLGSELPDFGPEVSSEPECVLVRRIERLELEARMTVGEGFGPVLLPCLFGVVGLLLLWKRRWSPVGPALFEPGSCSGKCSWTVWVWLA